MKNIKFNQDVLVHQNILAKFDVFYSAWYNLLLVHNFQPFSFILVI